ncbi:hypothetical protein MUN81_16520 [Hymenobacter sp. 5317J-9]|uniref:Galactose-1-phosphate uridylyltransferase n=1 Tax=Hymenobacter armeniacus TaxID=2771358 RepID=A0ABR8JQC3_9BACT|nr:MULTISPECIES: hypothetical protein [Hymenobacter]MBD2722033.1 hypothetical protein [Hymenobacter armeniacus]UOQ96841.1 hypothetical protein MUN81_16520 [Hymenobacter sp. 5317J-9]
MRIPPFYSPLRGIALTDVWHDNDECPVARSIAPADRVPGTGQPRPRCPYCALLDRPVTAFSPAHRAGR